jgi:uncharacterized protein YjbI with pentapeptide repeats
MELLGLAAHQSAVATHWRFDGKTDSAVVVVKASFRLAHGAVAAPLDEAIPVQGDAFSGEVEGVDLLGACIYASDLAPFKPRADVLVAASAHAPSTRPVTSCDVSVSLGSAALTLRVSGDRVWLDEDRASAPKPWTALAIGYDRAYGGKGRPANPVGAGHADEFRAGLALPNVEALGELVKSFADQPAPAGFGPLAPHWRHRMAKWPAVTSEWIEHGWPWAPIDLDYGYFNAAQPALQVEGWLRGDETLRCENLHPTHRRFEAKLPGARARAFLVDEEGGQERFREVPLKLDTVSADLEADTLVLVFRGSLPVRSRDLREVSWLYVADERLGEARLTADQHRQLFLLARSEAAAKKRAPDAREAAANENEAPPVAAPPKAPAAPAPPAPPKPVAGPLPPALRDRLVALGTPAAVLAAVEAGDLDGAKAITKNTFKLSDGDLEQRMAATRRELRDANLKAGGDPKLFEDPPPAPPPTAPAAAPVAPGWSRARVEAALASGTSLAGADLSKLDLSALDLAGRDLSGTLLTGAKLDGARLDAATLDGAVLTGASATGASFKEASLVDADCTGLLAPGASLDDAKLEGALLDRAELTGAKLCGVQARGASFRRATLREVDLRKSDLSGAILSEANLERAKLGDAKLVETVAEGIEADGLDLQGATLTGLRAGEGGSLRGAQLAGCDAERARFAGSDLRGADLRRARLAGADFGRARLADARLAGARLSRAQLTGASLERADLSGSDLSGAQLDDADLTYADLRGASLYQANLFQARVGGAQLDGADTTGTLLDSPVRSWAR